MSKGLSVMILPRILLDCDTFGVGVISFNVASNSIKFPLALAPVSFLAVENFTKWLYLYIYPRWISLSRPRRIYCTIFHNPISSFLVRMMPYSFWIFPSTKSFKLVMPFLICLEASNTSPTPPVA